MLAATETSQQAAGQTANALTQATRTPLQSQTKKGLPHFFTVEAVNDTWTGVIGVCINVYTCL